MTETEAKNVLRRYAGSAESKVVKEAFKMAEEALDKQTPEMVRQKNLDAHSSQAHEYCPRCDRRIYGYWTPLAKNPYCYNCGQRLRWEI